MFTVPKMPTATFPCLHHDLIYLQNRCGFYLPRADEAVSWRTTNWMTIWCLDCHHLLPQPFRCMTVALRAQHHAATDQQLIFQIAWNWQSRQCHHCQMISSGILLFQVNQLFFPLLVPSIDSSCWCISGARTATPKVWLQSRICD